MSFRKTAQWVIRPLDGGKFVKTNEARSKQTKQTVNKLQRHGEQKNALNLSRLEIQAGLTDVI